MVFFLPIFNSNSFFTVNKINNKAQSVVPAKNFTVFKNRTIHQKSRVLDAV